jgi:dGTPase
MLTKKELEQREARLLAKYATQSGKSRGRVYAEPPPEYRTEFQRDRDRVIHCRAFRRLKHKTQVFVSTQPGDHYRTRLTHSLEVMQISRDLARMLGLNEDLAETIALAHDLGHTPFGHTGERALNELLRDFGGFEHNRQSRKIVESIEKKYPAFDGLNLSYEVLDGLIKHRSPYDNSGAEREQTPSLEAQLVNLADEIAYNSHDLDDALASGLLPLEDLRQVGLWAELSARNKKENPQISDRSLVDLNIRALIGAMVNDVAFETERRLTERGVKTLQDVCNAGTELVVFSPALAEKIAELRKFLYARFYQHPEVLRHNQEAETVIKKLFAQLIKQPEKALSASTFRRNEPVEISIGDFIAGMTDQYALQLAKTL